MRGINLIASKTSGVFTYYMYNGHGDVVQLTDVNGYLPRVVRTYNYDAFGNGGQGMGDPNPFGYCGEYFDKETGTVYLRNRYYSPKLGRFTQEDPIVDGLNYYTYANCNPIRFFDPSGLVAVNIYDYAASYGYDINGRMAEVFFNEMMNRWVIYWGGYSLWITEGVNGFMENNLMFADDSLFIGAFGIGRDKLVVYQDSYFTNHISIRANFNITGDATYIDAFLAGIVFYWSGKFENDKREGYNVATHVGRRSDGISVNIIDGSHRKHDGLHHGPWFGGWSYSNPGSISMYTKWSDTKSGIALGDFELIAAHEFAHILGLKDTYNAGFSTITRKAGLSGPEMRVTQRDILRVLNAKKTGKWGK